MTSEDRDWDQDPYEHIRVTQTICELRDFGRDVMVALRFAEKPEARGLFVLQNALARELVRQLNAVLAQMGKPD